MTYGKPFRTVMNAAARSLLVGVGTLSDGTAFGEEPVREPTAIDGTVDDTGRDLRKTIIKADAIASFGVNSLDPATVAAQGGEPFYGALSLGTDWQPQWAGPFSLGVEGEVRAAPRGLGVSHLEMEVGLGAKRFGVDLGVGPAWNALDGGASNSDLIPTLSLDGRWNPLEHSNLSLNCSVGTDFPRGVQLHSAFMYAQCGVGGDLEWTLAPLVNRPVLAPKVESLDPEVVAPPEAVVQTPPETTHVAYKISIKEGAPLPEIALPQKTVADLSLRLREDYRVAVAGLEDLGQSLSPEEKEEAYQKLKKLGVALSHVDYAIGADLAEVNDPTNGQTPDFNEAITRRMLALKAMERDIEAKGLRLPQDSDELYAKGSALLAAKESGVSSPDFEAVFAQYQALEDTGLFLNTSIYNTAIELAQLLAIGLRDPDLSEQTNKWDQKIRELKPLRVLAEAHEHLRNQVAGNANNFAWVDIKFPRSSDAPALSSDNFDMRYEVYVAGIAAQLEETGSYEGYIPNGYLLLNGVPLNIPSMSESPKVQLIRVQK